MGRDVAGRLRREGTRVYLWLTLVHVWQKTTQFCKAIILQWQNFKKIKISKTKKIYIPKKKTLQFLQKIVKQLPSGYKSASKCSWYGVEPWPRNIPHAAGQLSLYTTTTEPVCCNYWHLDPCFTEKAIAMRSPCTTPRGSLHTATDKNLQNVLNIRDKNNSIKNWTKTSYLQRRHLDGQEANERHSASVIIKKRKTKLQWGSPHSSQNNHYQNAH